MRKRNEIAWFILIPLALCQPVSVGQENKSLVRAADRETSWRCANDYLEQDRGAVKLSSKSILARAVEKRPIRSPSEGKFTGTVGVQLVVGATGEVVCARGKEGNPFAVSAAIDSLRFWKFRPLVDPEGQAHVFYGLVTIPLR